MRKIILLLVLSFISFFSFSQDFSNKGKEFWLAYSYHVGMVNGGGTPAMTLYLTSDVTTTYTVEIFGGAVIASGTITAGFVTNVSIPNTYFVNADGIFSGRAIHVTAAKPIVVYSFITRSQASAASLCLPTNVLGKDYFAMSFTQVSNEANACSYITIVAVEDNTNIEIIPTAATKGGWAAYSTNIVTLNKGQVYQVLGNTSGNSGVDLSGTSVKSIASGTGGCKKIAVFSGSGKLALGCSGGSADNLYQQLYPVATWGKKYLSVPSYNRNNNFYRIIRSSPAANVTLNGVPIPAGSFTNEYYQFSNTIPNLIEADLPISVSQYFTSQSCLTNGSPYDPDMIILNPVEQNINQVTLVNSPLTVSQSPPNAAHQHHLHVIMRNGGTGQSSFTLDGASVPAGSWVVHPGDPNYSYLYLPFVAQGNHALHSDSGFNALAYGYGSAETYGYSAGANVKDLYQQIGVNTEYGIELAPSVCTNTPFKFKVSLPYCADSIKWNLSSLPGPPSVPPTSIYTNCTPGAGGPDSTTIVNGKTIYWYSLPSLYSFNTIGSYPVTITTYFPSGACGNSQDIDFDLLVSAPPLPSYTTVANGCYMEPVQFIETTPQTPKATYKWFWDFGDGNTSTVKNPSHTYAAPGTYTTRYASITTPGCLSDTIRLDVVVPDIPSATISGPVTACINSAGNSITFTATEGKAPYEFTYDIDGGSPFTVISTGFGNTVTIPVSTATAGTFVYHLTGVKNVGSTVCSRVITGQATTVIINPDAAIALNSATGTDNQALCINTAIANISYTISGGGSGASVTGLPAGLTGTYAAGVFTISGTPTATGTFNYTVTTSGICIQKTATGTITVNPDAAITLSSAAATASQALCINTPLTNITYNITGGGTGATVAGLPAGVTGSYVAGVFTISGIPTATGTFNYVINTTGTCVQKNATGSITVNPDAAITLSSAAGTSNQTLCVNTAISAIFYTITGGGTGATVSGLPAGVSGSYSAGVFTISGTPAVSGAFSYTVTTTGTCVQKSATGSIIINPDAAITLSSAAPTANQELCATTSITDITYLVTGGGTGATAAGLPAGVSGTYAGGVFTISGTPTVSGIFNYTVTTTGTCVQKTATGTITVNALPTPNFTFSNPDCENKNILFTDASLPNTGTVASVQWTFGDATSGAGTPVNHTYATAGIYTAGLIVTTSKGCSNPVPFTQQVTVSINPQAGFMVPEVCINDIAAVFTDTSKIGAPATVTQWYWDFGDPASGALNTAITKNGTHLYTNTGLYTVKHIAYSISGCSDTITHNIFINGANPTANFTVSNPAALCANDSVAITNTSTVAPGSITKVEIYWDNVNAPAVVETDDNPLPGKVYRHKYLNFQTPLTKTFTVRLVAYSGGICFNDKITTVTVNAAPKVQFNAMPDVCYDAAPFQITQASEIGGVPGLPPVYSGTGVSASGIFSPAIAGVGTHWIKYTFTAAAGGCVDTMSRPVTVLDTASAQFSFITPTCEGSATTFKDASLAPSGVTLNNTLWDFGDGGPVESHAPGSSFAHNYLTTGTYTVKMYTTSVYGCKSSTRSKQIVISPNPNPAFVFNESSICLPAASVSFTNNSSIADGSEAGFKYAWNFGDPASGFLNNSLAKIPPPHVYTGAGPYTVVLTVTSDSGCVKSISKLVNFIHPQPVTTFNVSKPGVCIGDVVTFRDLTDGLDGTITQWFWDLGDGAKDNVQQVTHQYTDTLVYNVSLYTVNSYGCKSTTLTQPFTVYPYPVFNAGPDLVVLEGGSITLQPELIRGTGSKYLWTPATYLNDNTLAAPTALNMLDDITYTLQVTGRGGCIALPDAMNVKVLKAPKVPNTFTPNGDGINETWKIEYLDTYPNCKVQVFTRTGQLVFESRGYKTPWNGTVKGKPLPFDTYYYIIEPENGRKPVTGYVTIVK